MSESTTIAWTHDAFNLVWGGSKISAGCKHCYAEELIWSGLSERRLSQDKRRSFIFAVGMPRWLSLRIRSATILYSPCWATRQLDSEFSQIRPERRRMSAVTIDADAATKGQ
jgi:hypothetical protein